MEIAALAGFLAPLLPALLRGTESVLEAAVQGVGRRRRTLPIG